MNQNIDLKKLKWIIYCRKSSDTEDKQIESLPAQEKELKEIAKKEGYRNIVAVYSESHSAFHPGRPKFNEMIQKLYSGEADAVLVWAGNRIARNSKDAGDFIYAMDQNKVLAVKTMGGLYLNTPDYKFALSIDFTVSKKSSDDLSVAVHRGNKQKFHENKEWGGPAKQGFINFTHPRTKKRDIKIDKERFSLIQQASKKIANGKLTPLEALDWLNEDMGYRTVRLRKQGGGPMSKSTFYKTLADPFYYGVMSRKIEGVVQETQHKYQKMLTKDEWDIIQIRLGKKSRARQKAHDFPFKEVMNCGECDGFVTAEEKWQIICPDCKKKFAKTKTRDNCPSCNLKIERMEDPTILHYTYYHCTKKVNKNCTQGYLEIGELEKQIDKELQKFEIDPDFKDWAIKHISELNDQETKQDHQATKRNTGNYENLKSRLRRMTKHRFSDSYEESSQEEKEVYEEELESLKAQIEGVKENMEVVDQKQYDWIELSRKTFEFACYSRYWFKHGDVKRKTQILQLLGTNLKLYNKKVLVDEDNLWWIIEKAKKEMEAIGISVEPTKKAGSSGLFTCFDPAIPILLRD
ncbi:MAG: recombinase family protein [Candidatus Pacebacteria bacterium]|jgi:site-specific DNA recombinase|nr:recombinase family protein [Candidatus Paceibacterota bacterium]MBT4652496.1 recombinase family protein [Candidatus Paceibacterota bacterium]MBT6756323.1 recombinase family protein [Candidatus Paceibacterota bacterium]MBT6921614.1 recombinase family protein [Candidatus Paceibacterota bacterium]